MSVVNNKIEYLTHSGRLHVFRVEGYSFIFHKQTNNTYLIDDNTYLSFKLNGHLSHGEAIEIDNFLRSLKFNSVNAYKYARIFLAQKPAFEHFKELLIESCCNYLKCEIYYNYLNLEIDIDVLANFSLSIQERDETELSVYSYIAASQINRSNEIFNMLIKNNIRPLLYGKMEDFERHSEFCEKYKSPFFVNFSASDIVKSMMVVNNNSNKKFFFILSDISELNIFFNFLKVELYKLKDLNTNISNLLSFFTHLLNRKSIQYEVYTLGQGMFLNIKKTDCDHCWVKRICWSVKAYKMIGAELERIEKFSKGCDLIRDLTEHIIFKMHKIELAKNNEDVEIYQENYTVKKINF